MLFTRVPPSDFRLFLKIASTRNSYINQFVHMYEVKEYERMNCFLSFDGKSGYCLKGKEIVSVFSEVKGRGKGIVLDAIGRGGDSLDCFDGSHLVGFYKSSGFKVVKSEANWNGKELPSVVYMRL